MVGLASKKLLLSWSNDLDIVRYWNCSFTKHNAQLHVRPVNHDRSRQCTYDSMFLSLIQFKELIFYNIHVQTHGEKFLCIWLRSICYM